MIEFKQKAVDFVKYFTNESNKEHFKVNVTNNSYLRDYYLYFYISGEESDKSFFCINYAKLQYGI